MDNIFRWSSKNDYVKLNTKQSHLKGVTVVAKHEISPDPLKLDFKVFRSF